MLPGARPLPFFVPLPPRRSTETASSPTSAAAAPAPGAASGPGAALPARPVPLTATNGAAPASAHARPRPAAPGSPQPPTSGPQPRPPALPGRAPAAGATPAASSHSAPDTASSSTLYSVVARLRAKAMDSVRSTVLHADLAPARHLQQCMTERQSIPLTLAMEVLALRRSLQSRLPSAEAADEQLWSEAVQWPVNPVHVLQRCLQEHCEAVQKVQALERLLQQAVEGQAADAGGGARSGGGFGSLRHDESETLTAACCAALAAVEAISPAAVARYAGPVLELLQAPRVATAGRAEETRGAAGGAAGSGEGGAALKSAAETPGGKAGAGAVPMASNAASAGSPVQGAVYAPRVISLAAFSDQQGGKGITTKDADRALDAPIDTAAPSVFGEQEDTLQWQQLQLYTLLLCRCCLHLQMCSAVHALQRLKEGSAGGAGSSSSSSSSRQLEVDHLSRRLSSIRLQVERVCEAMPSCVGQPSLLAEEGNADGGDGGAGAAARAGQDARSIGDTAGTPPSSAAAGRSGRAGVVMSEREGYLARIAAAQRLSKQQWWHWALRGESDRQGPISRASTAVQATQSISRSDGSSSSSDNSSDGNNSRGNASEMWMLQCLERRLLQALPSSLPSAQPLSLPSGPSQKGAATSKAEQAEQLRQQVLQDCQPGLLRWLAWQGVLKEEAGASAGAGSKGKDGNGDEEDEEMAFFPSLCWPWPQLHARVATIHATRPAGAAAAAGGAAALRAGPVTRIAAPPTGGAVSSLQLVFPASTQLASLAAAGEGGTRLSSDAGGVKVRAAAGAGAAAPPFLLPAFLRLIASMLSPVEGEGEGKLRQRPAASTARSSSRSVNALTARGYCTCMQGSTVIESAASAEAAAAGGAKAATATAGGNRGCLTVEQVLETLRYGHPELLQSQLKRAWLNQCGDKHGEEGGSRSGGVVDAAASFSSSLPPSSLSSTSCPSASSSPTPLPCPCLLPAVNGKSSTLGIPPLRLAISLGKPALLQLLLEAGADPFPSPLPRQLLASPASPTLLGVGRSGLEGAGDSSNLLSHAAMRGGRTGMQLLRCLMQQAYCKDSTVSSGSMMGEGGRGKSTTQAGRGAGIRSPPMPFRLRHKGSCQRAAPSSASVSAASTASAAAAAGDAQAAMRAASLTATHHLLSADAASISSIDVTACFSPQQMLSMLRERAALALASVSRVEGAALPSPLPPAPPSLQAMANGRSSSGAELPGDAPLHVLVTALASRREGGPAPAAASLTLQSLLELVVFADLDALLFPSLLATLANRLPNCSAIFAAAAVAAVPLAIGGRERDSAAAALGGGVERAPPLLAASVAGPIASRSSAESPLLDFLCQLYGAGKQITMPLADVTVQAELEASSAGGHHQQLPRSSAAAQWESRGVHKLVLCAHSAFFRSLFMPAGAGSAAAATARGGPGAAASSSGSGASWAESTSQQVQLSGLSMPHLDRVLCWMYTGELQLVQGQLQEGLLLLQAASRLGIPALMTQLQQWLAKQLHASNVMAILQFCWDAGGGEDVGEGLAEEEQLQLGEGLSEEMSKERDAGEQGFLSQHSSSPSPSPLASLSKHGDFSLLAAACAMWLLRNVRVMAGASELQKEEEEGSHGQGQRMAGAANAVASPSSSPAATAVSAAAAAAASGSKKLLLQASQSAAAKEACAAQLLLLPEGADDRAARTAGNSLGVAAFHAAAASAGQSGGATTCSGPHTASRGAAHAATAVTAQAATADWQKAAASYVTGLALVVALQLMSREV